MSVIKYPLNVLYMYIANVFDLSLVEYGFTYIIRHVILYCSNTLIYTNSIHNYCNGNII